MSKFYVVKESYLANSASANRMIGFLKAFSTHGKTIDLCLFMPDEKKSRIEEIENVRIHYYWRWFPVSNNFVRFFCYLFVYRFLFSFKVREGDTVLLLGCSDLLPLLSRKKGVRVYHQRTEHPDVVRDSYFLSNSQYLKYCRLIDGIFTISKPIKDYFEQNGCCSSKIHIINMTVDISRFENLEKEETDDYIAYCGMVSNNKDGVDQLIKAFGYVHKEIPNVKLYIIGKIPSKTEERKNIELISELGLKDSIVLTGEVDSDRMPQILKNAKVLLLDRPANIQSDYGFPTKLGEYLLTENPVVVTKVGTIPDFLSHNVSALLAEANNPIDFSSKVIWALTHQKDSLRIGKAGAEVARTCFNSEREAQKMYDVMLK